ncbi:MAG: T9SS type A sorting domain-containing protein [Crocinitomicaceae bacterium]|nr:T9SS type A sorting domain-containing protein [Crocinitomicaceae bacterium]
MKITLVLLNIFFCTTLVTAQWYDVPVFSNDKLNEIDFPSNSVGYIVGDSTTIFKTTNGGESWFELIHSGLPNNAFSHQIVDVKFVDEQIGFIAILNDNDGVYKTVDGGLNWFPASNSGSNMCYKSSLFVNSEDNYFIGGAGCFQSGQIDHFSSSSWSSSIVNYESFNPDEYIVEMDFNGNVGIAVMNGQSFLRSVDNGATWDEIPSMFTGDRKLTSVMFASADTVFAGYEEPILPGFGFLISTDAGLTWQNQSTIGFFYPAARGFAKSASGDLYAGGIGVNDFGIIFESDDWLNWSETIVDHALNGMGGYDEVMFAVGDNGYVIVNALFGGVGVEELNSNQLNIYPNPTKGVFTVERADTEPLILEVVDVYGNQLESLIEFTSLKLELDITHLPDGVYFIHTSNGISSTSSRILKF